MQLSLSIEDAIKATGLGRTKLYEAINKGLLPAKKYGKRTFILKKDIEEFLANLDPYPRKLHDQFLSLARVRSIENKKDNIIISNTGPSGLISEEGKIIKFPYLKDLKPGSTIELDKVLYFFDPTLDPLLTTPFGNGSITFDKPCMALTAA